MMLRILTGLLTVGTAVACAGEECDSSVSLLQFQVNVSASGELLANSTVEMARENGSGTVEMARENGSKQKEHTRANADNSTLMYLQRHGQLLHDERHDRQAKTIVTWISAALLFIVVLSLIRNVVPLLQNVTNSQSQESDVPESGGAVPASTSAFKTICPVVTYGTLYIICSCTLIKYNKYLMSPDRFPFAVNLTLGHQTSGGVFLYGLYKLRPSLYPALTNSNAGDVIRENFFRGLLPVALCFSGQLVLSNLAYIYTSVAFLQMMKEGNMVLVYALSLMAGLEYFHKVRAQVLLCLFLSTALTIQGEIAFSPTGFCVQGVSQLMEATKIVMQAILLSGSRNLDPYSYNLLVQPTTACLLGLFLVVATLYIPWVPLATFADYAAWFPHLVANCIVALSLNVVIAFFIANSSAVGFIIAGITKDICLVVADVAFSGTELSRLQWISFSLQVCFVATYSLLKTFAKQLEPEKSKAVTK